MRLISPLNLRRIVTAKFNDIPRLFESTAVAEPVPHKPVMKDEVVRLLNPKPNEVFLDMTFGSGGHTNAVIDASPSVKCFALDRDPEFLEHVERIKKERTNVSLIPMLGKFSQLPELCHQHGLQANSVDMILMDLGVSSMQLDNPRRGFGFKHAGRLDMRMDGGSTDSVTAEDVLNKLNAAELAQIFKIYGEERYARRIANAIYEHRQTLGPVRTATQLCEIIASVTPNWSGNATGSFGERSVAPTHPSARVFQALRIFVNDELNELCAGLELAERLLRPSTESDVTGGPGGGGGGRLVVISFHSLEDRLVKWALCNTAGLHSDGLAKQLASRTTTDAGGLYRRRQLLSQLAPAQSDENAVIRWKTCMGPVTPTEEEIRRNPRCRSAKLRFVEKA